MNKSVRSFLIVAMFASSLSLLLAGRTEAAQTAMVAFDDDPYQTSRKAANQKMVAILHGISLFDQKSEAIYAAIRQAGHDTAKPVVQLVTSIKTILEQEPLFASVIEKLSVGNSFSKPEKKSLLKEYNLFLGDCCTLLAEIYCLDANRKDPEFEDLCDANSRFKAHWDEHIKIGHNLEEKAKIHLSKFLAIIVKHYDIDSGLVTALQDFIFEKIIMIVQDFTRVFRGTLSADIELLKIFV